MCYKNRTFQLTLNNSWNCAVKSYAGNAASLFLRELLITFGSAGYVALFEIDDEKTVAILALLHQREEDYH